MPTWMRDGLLVGSGGFAGSIMRYLLSVAVPPHHSGLPLGTLAANLAGCFLMGVLAQLGWPAGLLAPEARLLLAVGFCGGLTTASTLVHETALFLREGAAWRAGGYMLITLLTSMAALALGVSMAKWLAAHSAGFWK